MLLKKFTFKEGSFARMMMEMTVIKHVDPAEASMFPSDLLVEAQRLGIMLSRLSALEIYFTIKA